MLIQLEPISDKQLTWLEQMPGSNFRALELFGKELASLWKAQASQLISEFKEGFYAFLETAPET